MSIKNVVKVLSNLILPTVLCAGFVACGTVQPEQTKTPLPVTSRIPSVAVSQPPPRGTLMVITQVARPTAAPVVATGIEPPQCTFPLAQTTTSESTPENYTFSEPKVVLTAPQSNLYNIAEWLPNNQQVLMTEELRNNTAIDKVPQETIKLYNPRTGESKVYAIRSITDELPSWNPMLNAVIYPGKNFLGLDQSTHSYKYTNQVWVSYGNPATVQMLADNLPQLPFAVKPDGSQTLYLSDKQISKLDGSLKELRPISFDSTQWDYAKEHRMNGYPVYFQMTWQPGTSLAFLYSEGAILGGGYTFILNTDTGKVCELNVGGWAMEAHWSPDGRNLAFIRSTMYTFPDYSADLAVLDTATGYLKVLSVMHQVPGGGYNFVDDFVWAPDNHHLLALGRIVKYMTPLHTSTLSALYLVDFASNQSTNIFPMYTLYTNSPQSMAWSPDGSKLLIRCPTNVVDRICFISVKQTVQP